MIACLATDYRSPAQLWLSQRRSHAERIADAIKFNVSLLSSLHSLSSSFCNTDACPAHDKFIQAIDKAAEFAIGQKGLSWGLAQCCTL